MMTDGTCFSIVMKNEYRKLIKSLRVKHYSGIKHGNRGDPYSFTETSIHYWNSIPITDLYRRSIYDKALVVL